MLYTIASTISALCVALIAVILLLPDPAPADVVPPVSGPVVILPPCEHEDGSGQDSCYWDADERGNGAGRSFAIIEGRTFYAVR